MSPSKDSFIPEIVSAVRSLDEEAYRDYWTKLGQFIHMFASVENKLIAVLRKMSGVSHEMSGVLFNGTRTESAKDHIYRILDILGDSIAKKRLSSPLSQLAVINATRNNLVHWGAVIDAKDQFLVENRRIILSNNKKKFHISTNDLNNIIFDLFRIEFFLSVEYHDYWDELKETSLGGPWRYKPPQPSPLDKRSPPNPPAPKRPRGASHPSQRERERRKPRAD
jgi:hypothetical protein